MKKVLLFLFLVFTSLVFKTWFVTPLIAAGDFPYYFSINAQTISYPFAWLGLQSIGQYNVPFILSLFPISPIVFFLSNVIHLPWNIIAKIVYFYPTLILSVASMWVLAKIMPQTKKFFLLSAFIFLFNTYTLMIFGGGQMLYALGMSIAPAVLAVFLTSKTNNLKRSLLLGILFALLIALDIRIAYMMMIGVGLFLLIKLVAELRVTSFGLRDTLLNFLYSIVFIIIGPSVIAGLLHAFWIVPTLFVHQNPFQQLGAAYSTNAAVKFFSFATFENTLSLLHPNWPENIFGKIYFMRPEFLVLPILAYGSLFFINGKRKTENGKPTVAHDMVGREKRLPLDSTSLTIAMTGENLYVIFFALLGLLGAFLAKGANDPFGGVYLWLFGHVPGFVMFRDPTKWYLLIAISYSMLIPFTVSKIYDWLSQKFKN